MQRTVGRDGRCIQQLPLPEPAKLELMLIHRLIGSQLPSQASGAAARWSYRSLEYGRLSKIWAITASLSHLLPASLGTAGS